LAPTVEIAATGFCHPDGIFQPFLSTRSTNLRLPTAVARSHQIISSTSASLFINNKIIGGKIGSDHRACSNIDLLTISADAGTRQDQQEAAAVFGLINQNQQSARCRDILPWIRSSQSSGSTTCMHTCGGDPDRAKDCHAHSQLKTWFRQ
jgi:hypothetical protein